MKGVYLIKNLKTKMVYIGSSSSIEERVKDHFQLLEENKHYNWKLQKDYNKYKDYFIWGIHTIVPIWTKREEVYELEQELLDRIPDRYNILLNATDHLLDDLSKRETSRQMKLDL